MLLKPRCEVSRAVASGVLDDDTLERLRGSLLARIEPKDGT